MKNNKFLKIKSILVLTFSLILVIACGDDNIDNGLDSNKVVAKIFDFSGPTLVNVNDVVGFSVTPRAGSTFVWEVNGAQMVAIEGTTSMINVSYNQVGSASISVHEVTASGKISDKMTQTVNVLKLCTWKIEMQDSYNDGWNGASIDVSYSGAATIDPVNIALVSGPPGSQTFSAPDGYDMTFTFNTGSYDNEITYQIFNASGVEVFRDGDVADPVIGVAYQVTASCP